MHHFFSAWRRGFFVLRDIHSQHAYLQEESLPGVLHLKKHSEFVLIIFYLQLISSGHAYSSRAGKNHMDVTVYWYKSNTASLKTNLSKENHVEYK